VFLLRRVDKSCPDTSKETVDRAFERIGVKALRVAGVTWSWAHRIKRPFVVPNGSIQSFPVTESSIAFALRIAAA
jgi:hypothetical protein